MADVNYTPHDWAASEFVTDTLMDQEIRDPWTNIQSPWSTFATVWAATGAPVIGNGTISMRYRRIGKTILFALSLTAGSTTTFGSGQWSFTLPATPLMDKIRFAGGMAWDSSAAAFYACSGSWQASSSNMVLWTPPTTAGTNDRAVNNTAPFTWASGDILTVSGSYEAA